MPLWISTKQQVERQNGLSESEFQDLVHRIYRQVLGNIHVTEYMRLQSAESLLRNQSISVRGFVDLVGNSDLYKQMFFFPNNPYRFIELNFKHFLGRAPRSQAEISTHVGILANDGYDAEISSYIYSQEYFSAFGEDKPPCDRVTSESIEANKDFVRILNLSRGDASSDRGVKRASIRQVATNVTASPRMPLMARNVTNNANGTFLIELSLPGNTKINNRAAKKIKVSYSSLSASIKTIQRSGGKILSIEPTV